MRRTRRSKPSPSPTTLPQPTTHTAGRARGISSSSRGQQHSSSDGAAPVKDPKPRSSRAPSSRDHTQPVPPPTTPHHRWGVRWGGGRCLVKTAKTPQPNKGHATANHTNPNQDTRAAPLVEGSPRSPHRNPRRARGRRQQTQPPSGQVQPHPLRHSPARRTRRLPSLRLPPTPTHPHLPSSTPQTSTPTPPLGGETRRIRLANTRSPHPQTPHPSRRARRNRNQSPP
jgi:hypothetical protein